LAVQEHSAANICCLFHHDVTSLTGVSGKIEHYCLNDVLLGVFSVSVFFYLINWPL